jgi:hypothetical protein
VNQLAEYSWSHFFYSPLITRGSAGKAQLVTLLLLYRHHPSVSWQSTLVTLQLLSTQHPCVSWQRIAGHTSVTLHSSPVDQLAKHSWSHFCYTPHITRGSAGRVQLVTLLLLSTHHPWISWKSTAGHASVTLHLSPVDQLAEDSWSYFCYSPVITRVSAGRTHWSHFGYSQLNTRVSAARVQLVTLLLLSSHHPCVSWQSTLVTFRVLSTQHPCVSWQLVTLLLLSSHHPWISWQSTAGHTSVTLHSSHVDQLAEHSWSHFDYSPLITRGSAGREQLFTFLLLSTHHQWVSWQRTAGHTSVTLHSSPVDQLAE